MVKVKVFLVQLIIISSCSPLKNMGEKFFTIKDSYYQSWMVNENDKGTNLIIELTGVKTGVIFDSVVFRGVKLPVYPEEKDDIVKLKSILYTDIALISTEGEISNLPDQLIFHYKNSKYSVPLNNIRRINMNYY
jgi:hypothetical protein